MDSLDLILRGDEQVAADLERIAILLGVGFAEEVRLQSGQLAKDLMRLAPPVGAGGGTPTESFAVQLRTGKKAITRDLARIYARLGQVAAEIRETDPDAARAFQRAATRGEVAEATRILQAFGQPAPLGIGPFDAGYHKAARRANSRGRVAERSRRYIVTRVAPLNEYRRELEGHLMWQKAGWLPAARAFGARGVHPSILRHAAPAGRYIDLTRRGGPRRADPTVVLVNNVSYAESGHARLKVVARAEATRRRQIEKRLKALEAKRFRGQI